MTGAGPERLELLFARDPPGAPSHPAEDVYGSAVAFPDDRPYVVANFVQTIDGVIAFGARGGWNASSISLDSEVDRRVMALLRAHADAIVVGGGTFRTARTHQWSPGGLAPDDSEALDRFRAHLRGPGSERAPLYVVSASGDLDPTHVAFTRPETRVTIVTTPEGAARIGDSLPPDVAIVSTAAGAQIDPASLVRLIGERGGGLILCEGGPTLLGDLTRAGLVDELFLTVAPQLAGRDEEHRRLGLIEGFAATPDEAPRFTLHSLRRAREHLFLRYVRI